MKFTLNWLKDHLETDATIEQIVETLTMVGLEVESVDKRGEGLEAFITAEIVATEKHPNADRLRVCAVTDGENTMRVVCGAPNARTGLKGVFAPEGSYIPGLDTTLRKARIRGVESSGMMLSEREMGLSDEHEGIVDLPADTPVGRSAAEVLGLDDVVVEIAVTPNRGDCNGVRGIARDLAAAGLGTLKPLDASPVAGTYPSPKSVRLDFDDETRDACPWFVGRYVRGVKNGSSPKWLRDRLRAVGLRPISALVDITNYMSIGLCRPLHAFDAARFKGDARVRLSKAGETMVALDGVEYTLDDGATLVCDEESPHGIGGIMGGLRSGCGDDTTDVFLECALFDPIRTAVSGRGLQILSDARYRFERGVDRAFLIDAMEIATKLVLELCGGEASALAIAGGEPDWRQEVMFRPSRVRGLTGVDVDNAEQRRILENLGFKVTGQADDWTVSTPSWRSDIEGEADIVEEIVRINGFDKIPEARIHRESKPPSPAFNPEQRRRSLARRVLANRGLIEAVTYSFTAEKAASLFAEIPNALKICNPISSDLGVMRPSVIPNLVMAAGRNDDRGFRNAALFELGPIFHGIDDDAQEMAIGGVRQGRTGFKHWASPPRVVDVFDTKADVEAVLAAVGAPMGQVCAEGAPAWYHPGRSGVFALGPRKILATFGELHPSVLRALGVRGPVAAFEIHLDALPQPRTKKTASRGALPLSPLMPLERDFAFVVDRDVEARKITRAALEADKTLITDVRVFDVFADGGLSEGKKSVAISVTLQPTDKTLDDGDLEAFNDRVVASVAKATGAVLRN